MTKFHNITPLMLLGCDNCGRPLDDPTAEILCPICKPRLHQIRAYKFGDCPKCGKRRPLHPDSGLCYNCGQHCHDLRLAHVAPDLKAAIEDVDRRISEGLAGGIHTDDLQKLIDIRIALADKI